MNVMDPGQYDRVLNSFLGDIVISKTHDQAMELSKSLKINVKIRTNNPIIQYPLIVLQINNILFHSVFLKMVLTLKKVAYSLGAARTWKKKLGNGVMQNTQK